MSDDPKEERVLHWNANMIKMGDELSRYLALKALCEQQQVLLKKIWLEVGFLKSELAEANDLKTMWRSKYLNQKDQQMNIWEKFKTLAEAKPILQRRNCWVACDHCKKRWNDIDPATEHVHMIVRAVQGSNVTRFICDNCLTVHKSNEDEAMLEIKAPSDEEE